VSRGWKPGDVAVLTFDADYDAAVGVRRAENDGWYHSGGFGGGGAYDTIGGYAARALAGIDPESDGDRARLFSVLRDASGFQHTDEELRSALREFANPTPPKPEEPTDPKARVTDRRDNIWRQLADGDWVCTSGPDIGEYLNWDQLAGDRGPVEVQR
jgi:hypothetical protein